MPLYLKFDWEIIIKYSQTLQGEKLIINKNIFISVKIKINYFIKKKKIALNSRWIFF